MSVPLLCATMRIRYRAIAQIRRGPVPDTNGYWLIPTAEVSLTNLAADQYCSPKRCPAA